MEQQGIQNVLRCLPQQVRSRIQQLTPSEQAQIQEIRLRAERPGVHSAAQQRKASRPGTSGFTENYRADIPGGVRIFRLPLCERDRRGLCDHCRRQPGGHCRVGSLSGGKTGADAPHQRSELSGLSCGDRLCRAALPADMPERPSSLLLAGAVGSGKTTMLRDLCRLLGHPGGSHWWMSAARSPPYTTACRSMMWDCTPMCWTAFHGQRVC